MTDQRAPMAVIICCVIGVGLLVVGQSVAGIYGSLVDIVGGVLIVGSIFVPAWLRASAEASHDEHKREKFAALNRRLLICVALSLLALASLALILTSFPIGDVRLLLGLIPLLVLLAMVTVAAFTAMSVRALR